MFGSPEVVIAERRTGGAKEAADGLRAAGRGDEGVVGVRERFFSLAAGRDLGDLGEDDCACG